MTQIKLNITKEECRIIRDALNKYAGNERKYQEDLLKYHSRAKVSDLMKFSQEQEKKKLGLGKKFSSLFLLTDWRK